jgi:hypothetical protein
LPGPAGLEVEFEADFGTGFGVAGRDGIRRKNLPRRSLRAQIRAKIPNSYQNG